MSQSDIKKFLEGLLVIYQICENVEESKVKETTSNKNLSLFVRLVFFCCLDIIFFAVPVLIQLCKLDPIVT